MRNQLIVIGIVAVLVFVGLSGCSNQNYNENQINNKIVPDKSKFIGHWVDASIPPLHRTSNNTIDFFSNGTCKYFNISATATWKSEVVGLLIIDFPNGTKIYPRSIPFDYVFSNSNKTLTLTNLLSSLYGPTFILTKE